MAKITLEMKRCMGEKSCPNCVSSLTKGYGYATDYHYKLTGKLICGYVEWDSELVGITDWCLIKS